MSIKLEALKVLVRELIKKELDEASVTGNLDGGEGPPKTPFAFKKKKKDDDDDSVSEASNDPRLKNLRSQVSKIRLKIKQMENEPGGYKAAESYRDKAKALQAKIAKIVDESVNEAKFHVKTEMGSIIVDAGSKGEAIMKVAKALKGGRKGIVSVNRVNTSKAKQVDKKLENVTEGKYHDYKNDESLTSKQKIGYSMREVRDKLNELDKIVKMNVRLKNEVGVDSTSYWKNTHNAMKKISERLVKLANKVGQLY